MDFIASEKYNQPNDDALQSNSAKIFPDISLSMPVDSIDVEDISSTWSPCPQDKLTLNNFTVL